MAIQTDAPGPAVKLDAPTASQGERTSTGVYQGREVKTVDYESLLKDASEELTTHSRLSEKSKKDAEKRDIQAGKRAEAMERIMRLEEMNEILSSLGDLNKDQLERAIKELLEKRESDPGKLRERASRQFEDPAHQYALLKAYAETLKQSGASEEELLAAATAQTRLLEGDSGVDVRAALNIGAVVNEYADSGIGDHKALRGVYRDNVKNYQDLNSTLASLEKNLSGETLAAAIDFVSKGLAADLAVEGSSIDKEQLRVIVNDMTWLKSSATIFRNCQLVANKAQKRGAAESFTDSALCQKIVTLQSASTVSNQQFGAIPDDAGFDEFEDRIVLLTDLTALIRLIPHSNYPSEQRRDNFISAAQDALDKEIEAEEAEEEYEEDDEV